MDSGGGQVIGELICPRDRTATRLQCTDCRTPICPSCFVRTPVGLKCDTCAAPGPAGATSSGRSRSGRWAVAASLAVLLLLAGGWALFGRSGTSRSTDDGDLGVAAARDSSRGAVVGTGRALDDRSWALEARRDEQGRICTRLTLTGAGGSRESCAALPSGRPFGPVQSRGSTARDQVTFQSWGAVSEATTRVRATAEHGTTADAEVFGGDAGLGVKFFMS